MTDKKVRDEAAAPTIPHSEPAGGTATEEVAAQGGRVTLKSLFKVLGPGLITGASDDDPSGIGTYTQAGAALGFATLWMAVFIYPFMAAVQFICAKIGMVTGKGLGGVIREHYSRKVLYPVLFALVVANVVNAGVDIGAISAAINLIVPQLPITVMIIPIAVIILVLQIWGSYRLIANVFKWLTLALFAYIGAALFAKPDWGEVIRNTFIPTIRLDTTFLAAVVAILGTSISPYLFFWQASQEVEEEVSMGRKRLWQRKGATNSEMKYAALDVNIGMVLSCVVMYFIILTTAATLFQAGKTDIQSATDAAEALKPIAGDAAKYLLALGLIGASILAVPILTGSASYAVAEAFGWKYGLDEKPRRAKQFYAVIVAATLVGMLINFVGINPITALFWTAVLNGFLAPPLMVVIMLVSNNKKIMGERTNTPLINLLGWVGTVIMFAGAIALVVTWLRPGA